MSGKLAWEITKDTFTEFMEDKVLRLSAAFAYYAVFALAPFLVIVIAVASLFFGRDAVQGEIHQQIQGFVGEDSAKMVESMVAAQNKGSSVIASIIGIVMLLFGATGLVGQLQDSLNTIWEVQPKAGQGIWGFIKDRFLSFGMVLGVAFLLLISMVISAMVHAVGGAFGNFVPFSEGVILTLNNVIAFLVAMVLFTMTFKMLPLAKVKWRDVWLGALITAVLFTLGKFLISLYIGRSGTTSAYGAAGSLVAILLWVYYSSIILFFGAEFTQVYAARTGSKLVPKKGAVRITEETRAQEGIPSQKRVEEKTGLTYPGKTPEGIPTKDTTESSNSERSTTTPPLPSHPEWRASTHPHRSRSSIGTAVIAVLLSLAWNRFRDSRRKRRTKTRD